MNHRLLVYTVSIQSMSHVRTRAEGQDHKETKVYCPVIRTFQSEAEGLPF